MTDQNELHYIRTLAKRFARAKRIAHHEALDLLADKLGHPHWNALTSAWKNGWRLSVTERRAVELTVSESGSPEQGTIDDHPYSIDIDMEVLVRGRGWVICIGEAPSEKPRVEVTDRRIKNNPILDAEFQAKALGIAQLAAEELRARIASDWPRRSTKPDAEGRTVHPLWSSNEPRRDWYCLHCDGTFTGTQMANNMWHCPDCSATPIDIFDTPFWKDAS